MRVRLRAFTGPPAFRGSARGTKVLLNAALPPVDLQSTLLHELFHVAEVLQRAELPHPALAAAARDACAAPLTSPADWARAAREVGAVVPGAADLAPTVQGLLNSLHQLVST